MLFQIKVSVTSECILEDNSTTMQVGDFKFDLSRNNEHLLSEATISKRVKNFAELIPTFKTKGKNIHEISFPNNPIKDELIDMLYYMESLGCFWFKINKIDFHNLEERWVPENDEEKRLLSVMSFKVENEYKSTKIKFLPQAFQRLIEKKEDFDYLVIPMHFYREGSQEFSQKSYFYAFVNFYLFIDLMFSNGKFKKKDVIEEYKNSELLRKSFAEVIRLYDSSPKKKKQIELFLKESLNEENLAEKIVDARGTYFHFSLKNLNMKKDPTKQQLFEPLAYLLLAISTYVVKEVANKPEYKQSS